MTHSLATHRVCTLYALWFERFETSNSLLFFFIECACETQYWLLQAKKTTMLRKPNQEAYANQMKEKNTHTAFSSLGKPFIHNVK